MSYSYATQRKIRIIKEKMPEWAPNSGGKSIDALYNELVGDDRKNLFCKIDSGSKDRLDEMTKHHRVGMAEFIEQLINAEYKRHEQRLSSGEKALLSEYS